MAKLWWQVLLNKMDLTAVLSSKPLLCIAVETARLLTCPLLIWSSSVTPDSFLWDAHGHSVCCVEVPPDIWGYWMSSSASLIPFLSCSLNHFNYRKVLHFFLWLSPVRRDRPTLSLLASSNQLQCSCWYPKVTKLRWFLVFFLFRLLSEGEGAAWPAGLPARYNQLSFISISSFACYAVRVYLERKEDWSAVFMGCCSLHLSSGCPRKGQADSSCWREIKGCCAKPGIRVSCRHRQRFAGIALNVGGLQVRGVCFFAFILQQLLNQSWEEVCVFLRLLSVCSGT